MAKQKSVSTPKDPMVDYVVGEFQRYESFHRERFEKSLKILNHWKNKAPKREETWQNAVHVPVTVEAEQTITPRIFTALFPTDAPIDVQVEGDAPEEQGIRIKSILQHYFRVANVQGESSTCLTQNTLFGTGYMEVGSWYVKRGWQVDEATQIRYNTILEYRPDAKTVDYFEMFPHPAKMRMDDPLPLIRRRFIDAETLKSIGENPNFNMSNLTAALASEPPVRSGKQNFNTIHKEYEILDYWGPWDESYQKDGETKTKKAVPYWIIIINRTIKIRSMPNPYNHQMPPFCKTQLFTNPEPSWFGVGTGEVGLSCQERLNKIVNQRLDNVDLVLNKQGCYNGNDQLINTKKLRISKPGQWHKVSDTVASLRWMDTPDVTSSSYKEEELAKQDFREATGATAHLMPGEPSEQHRTAMGIQLLQGAAGMRFRPVLRKLEIDLIQQTAMFFFSNLKQFMTEPEWIEITGKGGEVESVRITPEQIQAKVFFIPTGISETLNKEVQVGQLLRFKEITMNDPTVNRQEINKRIAELLGFKDIQKLIIPQNAQPGGEMPVKLMEIIKRRTAEGASPEEIKEELLGTRPQDEPEGGAAQ